MWVSEGEARATVDALLATIQSAARHQDVLKRGEFEKQRTDGGPTMGFLTAYVALWSEWLYMAGCGNKCAGRVEPVKCDCGALVSTARVVRIDDVYTVLALCDECAALHDADEERVQRFGYVVG